MWFSLVTFTTVGYGDMIPHTAAGMTIGALQCLMGLVSVALPATILQSNFHQVYDTVEDIRRRAKRERKGKGKMSRRGSRVDMMMTDIAMPRRDLITTGGGGGRRSPDNIIH